MSAPRRPPELGAAGNVLLRTLIAIPLLFLLIIVAWVAGMIVPPIADVVLGREAVHEVGFDVGVEVALKVGLQWVLPILALVIALWWIFGAFATDVRDVPRRRRGR